MTGRTLTTPALSTSRRPSSGGSGRSSCSRRTSQRVHRILRSSAGLQPSRRPRRTSLKSSCRTASLCPCQGGSSQIPFLGGSPSQHPDTSQHSAAMRCHGVSLRLALSKSLSLQRDRFPPSRLRRPSLPSLPCPPTLSPRIRRALSLWPRPSGRSSLRHMRTPMTSGTLTCRDPPGPTSARPSGTIASPPLHLADAGDGLTSTGGK